MRNHVSQGLNVDVIGANCAHDRSLRHVKVCAERSPVPCRKLIWASNMVLVEYEEALPSIGLVLCRHSTWPRTRPIEGNASSYSTSTMVLAPISFRHGTGQRSAQTFTWRKERSCAQFAPITSTLRPWET